MLEQQTVLQQKTGEAKPWHEERSKMKRKHIVGYAFEIRKVSFSDK